LQAYLGHPAETLKILGCDQLLIYMTYQHSNKERNPWQKLRI
jgi:hypothetical protein